MLKCFSNAVSSSDRTKKTMKLSPESRRGASSTATLEGGPKTGPPFASLCETALALNCLPNSCSSLCRLRRHHARKVLALHRAHPVSAGLQVQLGHARVTSPSLFRRGAFLSFSEELLVFVQVGRSFREQEVVCRADFFAVLNDWQDAGAFVGRPFAVLPLQSFAADILGIGGKALGGRHHPVEVRGQAFGTRRPRIAPGERLSRGHFGGLVFIAVRSRSHFSRPPPVVWFEGSGRDWHPGGHLWLIVIRAGRGPKEVA